jgi:hypothetical protein
MNDPAEPQLARLRTRFEARAQELGQVGFVLRGSLLKRFSRCGSRGCACHDDPPQLHGPYWQWTRKVKGKTVTRNVRQEELPRYRAWMANQERFDQIVQELQELSVKAEELLRARERGSKPPAASDSSS